MNDKLKKQIDDIMNSYDFFDVAEYVTRNEKATLKELTSLYGGSIDIRKYNLSVVYYKRDSAYCGKALMLTGDKVLVHDENEGEELLDMIDWMPLEVKYLIDSIKKEYPMKNEQDESVESESKDTVQVDKEQYERLKSQNEKMFSDLGVYRSLGASAISIHCQMDELKGQVNRALNYDYYVEVVNDMAYWLEHLRPMDLGRDELAANEAIKEQAVDFCVKACGPETQEEAKLNLCANRKMLMSVLAEDWLPLDLDDDIACDAAIRAYIARREWPKMCKNLIGG